MNNEDPAKCQVGSLPENETEERKTGSVIGNMIFIIPQRSKSGKVPDWHFTTEMEDYKMKDWNGTKIIAVDHG